MTKIITLWPLTHDLEKLINTTNDINMFAKFERNQFYTFWVIVLMPMWCPLQHEAMTSGVGGGGGGGWGWLGWMGVVGVVGVDGGWLGWMGVVGVVGWLGGGGGLGGVGWGGGGWGGGGGVGVVVVVDGGGWGWLGGGARMLAIYKVVVVRCLFLYRATGPYKSNLYNTFHNNGRQYT